MRATLVRMSRLRTSFAAILLVAASTGQAPAGFAGSSLLARFAGCVGRLSAQMEFQWLMSDPGSDQTQRERAAMITLVDALAGPDDGPHVLSLRLDSKYSHQRLLTRATFDPDPSVRRRAAIRAQQELDQCRTQLLGDGQPQA